MVTREWRKAKVLNWNLHSFQLLEIIQVLESISWVRCASGNVYCIDWKTDFREKSKLQNHQRTHTARGKIHACDVCDKSFSEPSGLKRHRLKHKEEKAFLCKHCSKYFSDSNLQSHHTEDRPVSCDKCEKLFKTKAEVQAHQIVQVKLFKFRHCKLTSKRLSELKILRGTKEFILV